jgi:hypothetical protein
MTTISTRHGSDTAKTGHGICRRRLLMPLRMGLTFLARTEVVNRIQER